MFRVGFGVRGLASNIGVRIVSNIYIYVSVCSYVSYVVVNTEMLTIEAEPVRFCCGCFFAVGAPGRWAGSE